MNEFEFKRFVPISKVDDEERMVYGYATTEALDSDGEIVSLSGIKKALPQYLQFPALREMHQAKAAGTVINTSVHEGDTKGLYIGAKVVADDAWKLVKEGVYRGFSIGGHVLKRVGNIIENLDLVEISLVDVPANKQAKIEVWKSEKITKDAETVYSLANIMIQLKDMIAYCDVMGKDYKALIKALEAVKSVIASEASQTEKESEKEYEDMYGEMSMSKDIDDLRKVVASLDRVKFDNPIAESLRKVVKENMLEKVKGKEKEEVVEPTPEVVAEPIIEAPETAPAVEEVPKDESPAGDAPVVEVTEEAPKEEVETKETVEQSEKTTMEKLNSISEVLSGVTEMLAKSKSDQDSFAKTVSDVAESLKKQNDILGGLNKRIEALEKTEMPTKSKASYLVPKDEVAVKAEVSEDLQKLLDRKKELVNKFELLGANEFAKQGLSKEAMLVDDKISQLSK